MPDLLSIAMDHHQHGRLDQAAHIYQSLLATNPRHADALHLLGVLALQQGNAAGAAQLIEKALAVNLHVADYHGNLAEAYRLLGELGRAAVCCRNALRLRGNYPEVLNTYGLVLQTQGRTAEAEEQLCRAVQLRPQFAGAFNNLANVRRLRKDNVGAIASLREAVRLNPRFASAHSNLGQLLVEQEQAAEAEKHCRIAIELEPQRPASWNNLGNALRALGKLDEAEACYAEALRLDPKVAMARNNVGQLREEQGRLDEAMAWYREALALEPGTALFHTNLAGVLSIKHDYAAALQHYQTAVRCDPGEAKAHAGLADTLAADLKIDEARRSYLEAYRLDPKPRYRIAGETQLPVLYDSVDHIAECRQRLWDKLQHLLADGVRIDTATTTMPNLFYLAYQGMNDRPIHEVMAQLGQCEHRQLSRAPRSGKIRVGFLSEHLGGHTIGRLNKGLIAHLSRADFEVTVLAPVREVDLIADEIQRSADRAVILPRKIEAALRLVAEQELDILFYTDIGMSSFTYTLAFHRLAPIQCVTWGHPVTTGLPTIDYFISSEDLETAQSEQHYTEKLARLPRLAVCFERPVLSAPPSRQEYGLPEDATLYACPQSLFKFHPDFDEVLAGILHGDPRGLVVLLEGLHPAWNERLRQRMARTMGDMLQRVRFVPRMSRQKFLGLFAVADVSLDPLHFGGGNTTYEALGLGTPVVTLPTSLLRCRLSHAMYRQIGWTELVATSPADYVQKVVRLGTDADYRNEVRRQIHERSGLLFDDRQAVRDLEDFFRQAVAERL